MHRRQLRDIMRPWVRRYAVEWGWDQADAIWCSKSATAKFLIASEAF